jgi:hypothetical protein
VTLKNLVKEVVIQLAVAGKEEFTAAEICETALKVDPTQKRRSVLGTLPGLVVGRRHPVYTLADQFLEKVGHGVYRIYKPPEKEIPKKRKRR